MMDEKYVIRLAEDFQLFFRELWVEIGKPAPALHQRDMADWLAQGPNRRGIRAFRGGAKTWETMAYVVWLLFRNSLGYKPRAKADDERITLISKSEGHGKKTLHQIRLWIESVPWLKHLRPDRKNGDRDTATHFDIPQAGEDRTPSLAVYGIEGMITGQRSTTLIPDDVETPENTVTAEQRQSLREKVKEFDRMVVPGGQIIYLGTPHHEETLYDELENVGYVFRTWPARYPREDEGVPNLSPTLQQRLDDGLAKPGDPVWPEQFDDDYLTFLEGREGQTGWLMQFMLVSGLAHTDRYPLRLEDLIVFPVHRDKAPVNIVWGKSNGQGQSTRVEGIPSLGLGRDGLYAPIMFDDTWGEYTARKMWVDPAKGQKGGDKIGYAVVAHAHGYLWAMACGGLSGGQTHDNLTQLAIVARANGVTEIHVEDFALQTFFAQLLEPVVQRHFTEPGEDAANPEGWRCSVHATKPPGGAGVFKESRIIGALEPVMNQHRLVVDRSVAENQDLQHQMTRITRQRGCLAHDDELESLANAVWLFEDTLNQAPEKQAEKERQRQIDEQMAEFMAMAGYPRPQPRWFQHH